MSPLPAWTTNAECLAVLWLSVGVDAWPPACSYLSSRCEGCSSWCRYRTGWTRTQTWKSPETFDILYRKFKSHISTSPRNNQQTCNTCVCVTCMWQPAAMVVGIVVKLTASTWPTAEVWLAWMLVGVTGPSWVKKAQAWDWQPPRPPSEGRPSTSLCKMLTLYDPMALICDTMAVWTWGHGTPTSLTTKGENNMAVGHLSYSYTIPSPARGCKIRMKAYQTTLQ